jgi:HEAT repeat protein
MNPSTACRLLFAAGLLFTTARAQEWTDEQLVAACQGFQADSLPPRLQQIAALLAERSLAYNAMVARVHGDHREYRLRIERLLAELADPRWQVRENAERTLIEVGGGAVPEIEAKKDKYDVLDQQIRCARVLDALVQKGHEQEDRERNLLKGLVRTSLYLDAEPRLLRALRSALGHANATVADAAYRALGRLGGDDEADAVIQAIAMENNMHRMVAVSALARMHSVKAGAACRQLLWPKPDATGPLAKVVLNRTESMAVVRALHTRDDAEAKLLLHEIAQHPDPVLAAGAKVAVPPAKTPVLARFTLAEHSPQQPVITVQASFVKFFGDSFTITGGFESAPPVNELSLADCDTFDFPEHVAAPAETARVFLNQGTLVHGDVLAIDADKVRMRSPLFGELTLPRKDLQGIAYDPKLDRLIGASSDHDRVKLRDNSFIDGNLLRADASTLVAKPGDSADRSLPLGDVAGVMFTRPRLIEPDATLYTRIDTVGGERLIGFVADCSAEHVAISVPLLGTAVIPWTQVTQVAIGVGGGATWGYTMIADYSDNKVIEVDEQGRVVWELNDVFGAWDAEALDNGNVLITEFSVSRVREVTRKGETVWEFEELKNPYKASRLPNGNTLIADSFGSRVIEVNKEKQIVWSYAKDIRPFNAQRLPNGNTLIADVLKDRVIEVSPAGEIVWEVKNLVNCHDADRLPNGNTLVTLRNKGCVLELDRDGKVVWELQGLSSPSDADRLPNGNTLVAENTRVREFDRRGNVVWQKEMTWAVEANRY